VKLHPLLVAELDNTGLPWDVVEGTRHHKVRLCGHMVGIYPKGNAAGVDRRALLNTISQVRRAARGLKTK